MTNSDRSRGQGLRAAAAKRGELWPGWYADDERIRHSRIQLLFSQSIRRDDREGAVDLPRYTGWLLDVGVDRQPVEVEDAALVVIGIDGDPQHGFDICTNDRIEGELDCETLERGEDDVLYCSVDRGERGRLRARFLRPAYYRFARFVEVEGGHAVISSKGKSYRIG